MASAVRVVGRRHLVGLSQYAVHQGRWDTLVLTATLTSNAPPVLGRLVEMLGDEADSRAQNHPKVKSMSRYLFVTWNGAGNQPPAIGLAQALRSRGHEIVFAGYASQQPRFEESGFRFVVMEASEEAVREASGEQDLARYVNLAIRLCTAQLHEVPQLFASEHADALVIDCMMFAALAATEVSALPAAVLVHSAPGAMLRSDGTMGVKFLPELNTLRTSCGLPSVNRTWDAWRGMPVITNSVRQLDPLAGEVPAEFHYVGPIFEQVRSTTWSSPWTDDDDRPLVLVSFSTGGSSEAQRSRLERTLMGLAERQCRILATFSQVDISDLDVPENAVLVRHVPHTEVLPQVDVTVTHAGHGTTIAALAFGVPLVCLPQPLMPPDQAPLAAQVQALGVGRALDGDEATPADIADAVFEVLADPSYRVRAGLLADSIRTLPGPAGSATMIERLVPGNS